MNRKNTILIAVMINAGLLAVLLIAALTTQDEVVAGPQVLADAPSAVKFDEPPLFNEIPLPALPEPRIEIPVAAVEETLVHKLPPLSTPEPAAPLPLPPLASPPSLNEITVKKGDSLEKIAKAHHTTVDQLIKLNHLTSNFLKIGQILKIPTEKAAVIAKALDKKPIEMGPEYYTMKVGDNPWAIAMKHHMKVEELLRLNGLNEERARKLKPGDRLRIR